MALAAPVHAHDPDDEEKKAPPPRPSKTAEELAREQQALEVTVQADKPGGEAASRVELGRRELELRPRLRPGDILEAVPGLFAVQHAGGGKANQYFLRGFDADHGTDVAFFVDGVPVNMVSHGHGQGFSDFHFLIPELVVGLEGYKGTYYAQLGDFATAGAVNLRLAEKFDESYAQFGIGQYGIMRGLVVESPDLGDDWRVVAAAELYKDDGPFANPEQLKRLNLFVRATHDLGPRSKLQMTWMSYGSSWNGSGQIPARDVCGEGENGVLPPADRCIGHFGNIDPTEGGATQRHEAQLAYSTSWQDADFNAMAYFVKYDFKLYSNFTFFAVDHARGDEIEQDDDRMVGGFDARYRKHYHYLGGQFTTTLGAQVRFDSIDNALYHDEARQRLSTTGKAHVNESETALYLEEDLRVRRWLRFLLGARVQRIDVGVDDQLGDSAHPGGDSGAKGAMMLLPKASAVVSPVPQLDLFLAYGVGFHSNDARGAVQERHPATLMTKATGYEVGARARPLPGLELSAAGFLLDLDSEQVWAGDAGTTEASGQTRRYGVELTGRYRYKSWLFADASATFTHAAYRVDAGNGDAVALAPTRTFSAGVGARPTFGDFTPFADIRVKSIGARPATQDARLTADGFTVVDANAGLRWKRFEVGVDIQNLFNATWREVQFATDSRLPFETKVVTGINYSPGWPFTAIGRATVYWK
jgi:hypothetical protein